MQDTTTREAHVNFTELTAYAKSFSGLTHAREQQMLEIGQRITPKLNELTDAFYQTLLSIPKTATYLEGRVDALKKTHVTWLERLFKGPFDENYTASLYRVGTVHVKVSLPVEFMAGGIALINDRLISLIADAYEGESEARLCALTAVNAALGFSLIVMQESYQAASLHEELERFLKITGMSRALFNNLASAYKN